MKKIISLILLVVLCISMSVQAFASGLDSEDSEPQPPSNHSRLLLNRYYQGPSITQEYEEDTRAPTVCNGKTYHDMLSQGWGDIIMNGPPPYYPVQTGACWQCTSCYLVVITQGEPLLGQSIGYWATWSISYKLTTFLTIIYTNAFNYTSASSISGYRFRYN